MVTKSKRNQPPQQALLLPMAIRQMGNQKVSYFVSPLQIDEKKDKGHSGAYEMGNFDFTELKVNNFSLIHLDHRRAIADDEPQLTDDEDSNGRDVPSVAPDLTELEQQKKRRRTANYQHTISTTTTTTTNGHHEDERASPPLSMSFDFDSLS